MRSIVIAATALAVSASALAANPALSGSPEISVDRMKEAVRVLSSDEYEGRAPGTPGEEKTAAYLVEQFKAVGLQPGNKGSWFQQVPLVDITASN